MINTFCCVFVDNNFVVTTVKRASLILYYKSYIYQLFKLDHGHLQANCHLYYRRLGECHSMGTLILGGSLSTVELLLR
jgi:hypothetical protein